jgi:integrase
MRELLRDYVLILTNTGMRHGTEAQNLRWKHITTFEKDGRSYVAMYVKGKTRGRELIARHNCLIYLKRIHQRCRDIADMTFEELLASKSDTHVFRLPDGTITHSLNQTFRQFMKDSGLLKDPLTGHNRTLYSLRHTYATFQVIGGVDLHLLAKQMGTSIAMLEAHYSHLQPRLRAETLAAGGDDTSEKKPLRPTARPRPISPVELQAMSDDELTNKFKQH